MRLSNRNKIPVYNFLSTFLLMLVVIGIVLFFIEREKVDILGWESIFLIIIPVLCFLVFYLAGRQVFEYDSDGEALNFKNKNVVSYLGKEVSDEFPKYKLIKFDIVSFLFFKRLYITISSKKSHSLVLKYDISYLSAKEIRDLKISLKKVQNANRENEKTPEKAI